MKPYAQLSFTEKMSMMGSLYWDSLSLILSYMAPKVNTLINIVFLKTYGDQTMIAAYSVAFSWY